MGRLPNKLLHVRAVLGIVPRLAIKTRNRVRPELASWAACRPIRLLVSRRQIATTRRLLLPLPLGFVAFGSFAAEVPKT